MTESNDKNGGLYFIVGALLVAVVVLGVFLVNDTSADNDNPITVIERTVENTADSAKDGADSINLNVDEDGVSGSVNSEN